MEKDQQRLPIWSRPERGSRGPDPALDRDTIAAAAIALADAGGLKAVSMRGVAGRLNTSASALYRYVDHRSDLLDLMVDRVVAELRPYPAPGPTWLEPMVQMAAGQRSLHERHTWLIELGYRSSGIGPEALSYFEACLGLLAAADAPMRAKFEAIALVTGLAVLFAQQAGREQSGGASVLPAVDLSPYPHLANAVAHPTASPHHDDLFDRAIRSVLLGLVTTPESPQPGPPS